MYDEGWINSNSSRMSIPCPKLKGQKKIAYSSNPLLDPPKSILRALQIPHPLLRVFRNSPSLALLPPSYPTSSVTTLYVCGLVHIIKVISCYLPI